MLVSAAGAGIDFDGRRVLDGVDITIEAGQQVAVTGRSGSGKTTLLLLLAGLLEPTRGSVRLELARRDCLYVPQAPSLVPELSALENASLGLRLRGIPPPAALARAGAQLELLGLGDAFDVLPAELSGGMQQRVALARATAVEPKLLLTDEPTGTLDRNTGEHILHVLMDLVAATGAALVIATHDPAVAALMSRRLVLSDGRVAV